MRHKIQPQLSVSLSLSLSLSPKYRPVNNIVKVSVFWGIVVTVRLRYKDLIYMLMAAGPASPTDRAAASPVAAAGPAMIPMQNPMMISDSFARDAILAWYRGEFAAANAIIDALCAHLTQLAGAGVGGVASSEYDAVFAAIHRRRLNWIPVLQMQKYHSIADVAVELRRVAAPKKKYDTINEQDHADSTAKAETKKSEEVKVAKLDEQDQKVEEEEQSEKIDEKVTESDGNVGLELGEEDDSSPDSDITDSGKCFYFYII